MTNEELLMAIKDMRDEILAGVDSKLAAHKVDVLNGVKILLENDVQMQINLIAEDVKAIREQLPKFEEQEALRNDVDAIKAVVKIHTEDIQALKKAQ